MKKAFVLFLLATLIFTCTAFAMDFDYIENLSYEDRIADYKFYYGMEEVWRLGESAIVNNMGEIIIDYSSKEKGILSNGLIAIVGDNGKIGFYNQKGEQVTDYIYDSFTDTHEKTGEVRVGYIFTIGYRNGDKNSDLIPVSKDGKFGYINSYGTVIIPFKYEYAYGFKGGIARICADGILSDYGTYTNGKYGFIKEDGTEILPPDSYWVAWDFDETLGYATATNGINDTVIIDRWGNVKKNTPSERSLLDIKYVMVNPSERYYGIEDKFGNIVIPLEKSSQIVVKGDLFIVNNTLRNSRNEVIYSKEGIQLYDMGDVDLLRTSKSIMETGCIDLNGNTILEPVYESVYYIGDSLIRADKDSKHYIMDLQGNVLWEMTDVPVTAHNGFIFVNNRDTMITKVMINPIKRPVIYLNGERIGFTDAYPYLEGSRTMIPLRSVFEKAGAEVIWNEDEYSVSVKKDGLTVSMKIGDKKININDKLYETDAAPVIINERTYIPLRVFSEGIGMNVKWDEEKYKVYIEY